MKKSNIIVLALSTLLVVCNALPMNNVENKKEIVISQKEASKRNQRKKMYPKMKPMKVIKV